MWATKPYLQAVQMQSFLLEDAINPTTKPSDRAQVARAWDVLEDRKRVLKGKGAPKPVDTVALHEAKRKRAKPSSGFTEAKAKPGKAKVEPGTEA